MNEQPKRIYAPLPEEIKDAFPHGQWVFDTPGLILNFLTQTVEGFDYLPDLEPACKRLAEFLASDEELMAFESPHTPGINYLHRHAASRIIATIPAWSRRVYARTRENGSGVAVHDAETGLPVIRKIRN
jgi:hypothetical protein